MITYFSNCFFKGPNELIVTLKNGTFESAIKEQREIEIEGVYNLGPELNNTNGSPYWLQKNGKLAIWKSPDQPGYIPDNNWIFGNKEDIGSSRWYGVSSSGNSTGPYDVKWTYRPPHPLSSAFDVDLKIEFDMLEKVDAISIGKFIF